MPQHLLPKYILLGLIVLILCSKLINPVFGHTTCSVNDWCRPTPVGSQSSIYPQAEYKFIDLTWRMTWFDALNECRREGSNSELLSFESSTERSWVLNMAARQTYKTESTLDRMWLVNAHMHLYNSEYPAWANGQQLEMNVIHTATPNNCSAWGTSRHVVEEECYGLVTLSIGNQYLVDLNCTTEYTYRAICKRPTGPVTGSKPNNNPERFSPKFNPSEWVQSQRDENHFYRIVNLEREFPSKSNWYSARLLCKKYGAALSDIEDYVEYEFLADLIRSNYRNERQTGHTGYFLDLHRYLYDTQEWSWGGPPNSHRSFVVNLPNTIPPDYCEPRLCAVIKYSSMPGQIVGLRPMYCGGSWQALAICKKRLPQPTTKSTTELVKDFVSLVSREVLLAIIGILIMIILIGLGIVWYRSKANNKGIYNVFAISCITV